MRAVERNIRTGRGAGKRAGRRGARRTSAPRGRIRCVAEVYRRTPGAGSGRSRTRARGGRRAASSPRGSGARAPRPGAGCARMGCGAAGLNVGVSVSATRRGEARPVRGGVRGPPPSRGGGPRSSMCVTVPHRTARRARAARRRARRGAEPDVAADAGSDGHAPDRHGRTSQRVGSHRPAGLLPPSVPLRIPGRGRATRGARGTARPLPSAGSTAHWHPRPRPPASRHGERPERTQGRTRTARAIRREKTREKVGRQGSPRARARRRAK